MCIRDSAGVERRVCGRGAADGAAQEGEPPRGGHARACGQTSQTRTLARKGSYAGADPALPSRPREPSLPGQCERSDHRESTDTRQLIEVKPYRARLVLRWVTTLESRVALSFLFAIFAFFCPLLRARRQGLRACMPNGVANGVEEADGAETRRRGSLGPPSDRLRPATGSKPNLRSREAWRRTSAQSKFRCLGVGVHARPHPCRRGGSSSHGCSRRMRWR